MRLTDTHSHLYAPEFDADREEALARAADAGVERVLLPAIDSESHERLFGLCRSHPAQVHQTERGGHGGADYLLPKKWVKLTPPRTLSPAQAQVLAEMNARNHKRRENP